MSSLKDIPGIGFFERRKLQREGYELVHTERVPVTVYQNDTRTVADIYPPQMKAVIAQYGGSDKVQIKMFQFPQPLAQTVYPQGSLTIDTIFYVLGKPANLVQ